MAGELIGALRVSLGLDSAQFEAGMKKSRATASRDANAIQKTLTDVKSAVTGLVAAVGGSALVGAIGRALDYAGSLGEVAQQLGVTTQQLQVYRYAAGQVGISQEEMDKSLAKLTKTIGQAADGSKVQAKSFSDLGISLRGANGDILTAGDAIPKIADALARVKDPAVRARIETELFGKAGQKLDTLLSGGSAAIDNLRNAAEDLGIVLSDDQIQNADRTADKLTELKTVLEANIASAVANNAAAIYDFINSLESLVAKIPGTIRWLGELNDQFNIAFFTARQSLPYLTQGAREQAIGEVAKSRLSLAQSKFQDTFYKLPKASQETLLRIWPSSFKESVGLSGGGGAIPLGSGLPRGVIHPPSNGGGKKSGGADKAAREAERKARADRRFDDEMDRLQADQLDAQAELNGSVKDRYRAAIARLDADQASFNRDTNADKELSATQKAQRIAANDELVGTKRKIAEQKLSFDLADEAYERAKAALDAQEDELQNRLSLAGTIKERRDLEMQILAVRKKAEAAAIEHTLATAPTGSEEYANANIAAGTLDSRYDMQARVVASRNLTPWQEFQRDLHDTASGISEEFEGIAVSGIKSFNDGLTDAIVNGKSLGDVFSSVLKQIESDIIHLALTAAENSLFGGQSDGEGGGGLFSNLFGGKGLGGLFGGGKSSGSGGGGGINALIHSIGAGGPMSLHGYANGGSFAVGGNPGIDRNILSINGIPRARVSASERINVANDNRAGGGAANITVTPSKYFDVHVDGRASVRAAAVSGEGYRRIRRSQSQSLIR